MNVYDYSKLEKCYVIGSIGDNIGHFIKIICENLENVSKLEKNVHPKEIERNGQASQTNSIVSVTPNPTRRRKKSKPPYETNLTKSLIIVDGSNCFDSTDPKYYYEKFELLNKVLEDNNSHILFVRGGDNPIYFKDEIINMSNIKTLKDNSIIKLKNFNCLCIGGGISIDRSWKREQEKYANKKLYWEDEGVVFNEDEISEILKEFKISLVVSSCSPSIANDIVHLERTPWKKCDKELVKDLKKEMNIMDSIYSLMEKMENIPIVWAWCKTNVAIPVYKKNTSFHSLQNLQIFKVDKIIKDKEVNDDRKLSFTNILGNTEKLVSSDFNTRLLSDDLMSLYNMPTDENTITTNRNFVYEIPHPIHFFDYNTREFEIQDLVENAHNELQSIQVVPLNTDVIQDAANE